MLPQGISIFYAVPVVQGGQVEGFDPSSTCKEYNAKPPQAMQQVHPMMVLHVLDAIQCCAAGR